MSPHDARPPNRTLRFPDREETALAPRAAADPYSVRNHDAARHLMLPDDEGAGASERYGWLLRFVRAGISRRRPVRSGVRLPGIGNGDRPCRLYALARGDFPPPPALLDTCAALLPIGAWDLCAERSPEEGMGTRGQGRRLQGCPLPGTPAPDQKRFCHGLLGSGASSALASEPRDQGSALLGCRPADGSEQGP